MMIAEYKAQVKQKTGLVHTSFLVKIKHTVMFHFSCTTWIRFLNQVGDH